MTIVQHASVTNQFCSFAYEYLHVHSWCNYHDLDMQLSSFEAEWADIESARTRHAALVLVQLSVMTLWRYVLTK